MLNLQSPEVSGGGLKVSLGISSQCYIRPGIWEYRNCIMYLRRRQLRSFMIKNRHGEKRQTAKSVAPAPIPETTIRGYKVKVSRQAVSPDDVAGRRAAIASVMARSLGKSPRTDA